MSNVTTLGSQAMRISQSRAVPVKVFVVPGPPGPRGADGTGGGGGGGASSTHDHTQMSPATVWYVAHNLGFRPNVSTASVGGMDMRGEVQHTSLNVLTITFVKPVAGTAHLS